jgi:FkbM family methyltransferase
MSRILSRVKTGCLAVFGPRVTAVAQAIRFAWKVKRNAKRDPEFSFVNAVLSAGDVAIDVGANGADWTSHLSQAVGSGGSVLAFEADPYYAQATRLAIRILGMRNVEFFSFGLSDSAGFAYLRVVRDDGTRMSGEGHVDREISSGDTAVHKIELKTLDSMIEDFPVLKRTRLLKIDVEGFEMFVLKGASRILSEARPIVILEVGNFERFGYQEADIVNLFRPLDYSWYAAISADRLEPADDSLQHPRAASVNRIFVPSERRSEIEAFLCSKAGSVPLGI